MVEMLIDLIVRKPYQIWMMFVDWLRADFSLWTVMWHPTREPAGSPPDTRTEQMRRYFRVSPEPGGRWQAFWLGWSAVLVVAAGGVLLALGQIGYGAIAPLIGVLVWFFALEQTAGYDFDYRRSLPKPVPADIGVFLRDSLDQAVGNALAGADLDSDAVRTAIHRALGLPDGDPAHARPPVVHGPVHRDKDLPVILGGEKAWYRAYNVLVLCPSDHHLVIYRARLDMISGKFSKGELREVYPRDVALLSVVDTTPDVTFHARASDGTVIGTRTEKEKLRELTLGSGQDEDRFAVELYPGDELDTFLTALRGLLKEHKTAPTRVEIVKPLPMPAYLAEPGVPIPVAG